jgi:hypothetical protein
MPGDYQGNGSEMSSSQSTRLKRERPAAGPGGSPHPTLFIEAKVRAASATWTLWTKTRDLAIREGKVPVLMLCTKRRPGALVVVHQDDLAAVATELSRAGSAESTDDGQEQGAESNRA